jgi:hypothetical protein
MRSLLQAAAAGCLALTSATAFGQAVSDRQMLADFEDGKLGVFSETKGGVIDSKYGSSLFPVGRSVGPAGGLSPPQRAFTAFGLPAGWPWDTLSSGMSSDKRWGMRYYLFAGSKDRATQAP